MNMHAANETVAQPPSTGKVVAKSLLFGGLLVFCEAAFLLVFMGDSGGKMSTQNKIIACSIFIATLAATLTYGLCNPMECGESTNNEDDANIRTPTAVTGGLFTEANHQDTTTMNPLLSQQSQDEQNLPTPRH